MKKKMIIYMSKLSVGGMERALLNLIKQSNFTKNYDVTIYVLYSIEENYLKELQEKVKVELLWKKEWNILGKIVCSIKMMKDLIKLKLNKSKYDVAICYPYQHKILSILTRNTSKNNIIFIHNNLKVRYGKDLEKQKKKLQYDKFAKVICVSNDALKVFKEIYPNYNGISVAINNYIDGKQILELSNENPEEKLEISKNKKIFISIARHEEQAKKITRIIEASYKLKKENKKFQVLLIGDGENHQEYKELINKYKLEKEVLLLGKRMNPYSYLKQSDCLILSSEYEGYGIVLDESRILNKPFISTDVADAKLIASEGYGIICENSSDGVYNGMKDYLENGYTLKSKFDYKKFNSKITKLLDDIVERQV